MVARTLQKLSSQGTYVAKELSGFAGWAVPGGILAGWLVWPGLTPVFKEEVLGVKQAPAAGSPAFVAASKNFNAVGKYKFVKTEIGERPTLEEE